MNNGAADGGLRISGLHKAFGSQAVLRGVDLVVPAGSLTAILGSSGSGKTTLLRLLAGFERPDGGTIRLGGRILDSDQVHVAPQSRGIGYVPQEGALFPHLDVAANIGFGLRRRRRRGRVAELLELTGLGPLAHRYPHQLSGGQQQRVALARSLATQPGLMLLDEPFSSLDASLRTSVRSEVAEVLAAAGTTALLVTHDQDEALSMADQVAVLRHGRFVQSGPPAEVYVRPVDAEVAAFVGDANLLRGRVDTTPAAGGTGMVDTVLGRLTLAARVDPGSGRLVVLVRPEQIVLAAAGGAGGVAGTVRHCEYHGHDTVLAVEVTSVEVTSVEAASGEGASVEGASGERSGSSGSGSGGAIQVRVSGEPRLQPGAPVTLRVVGPVVAWNEPDAGGTVPSNGLGGDVGPRRSVL